MASLFPGLSRYEDSLVEEFHDHPFFRNFPKQSDEQLKAYLIQKTELSRNFVPWYARAIVSVSDPEAKALLRSILDDEMPAGKPTHQEDLLADLEYIGVPKEVILNTKPTYETLKAKKKLDKLVDYSGGTAHDLRVLAALRMAGEILVAEEYRHVVPELDRRFGLKPETSRFYYPHFKHDEKSASYEDSLAHSDSFEAVLGKMISGEEKLAVAKESAKAAFDARLSFFDQFTARHKALKAAKRIGIAAAAAALAYLGATGVSQETEREKHAKFLSTLASEARQKYLYADEIMLRLYEATGNRKYLEKVGTMAAVEEAQLEGP